MPISMSFCLRWMCRSYTIHVGIISAIASVTTAKEEKIVKTVEKLRHFEFGVFLSHKAAIGVHWNINKHEWVIAKTTVTDRRIQIAHFTPCFCPVMRNKKHMIEDLMSARMGTYAISVYKKVVRTLSIANVETGWDTYEVWGSTYGIQVLFCEYSIIGRRNIPNMVSYIAKLDDFSRLVSERWLRRRDAYKYK